VSYWAPIFPNHFAFAPVPGAEPVFMQIAFGRVSNPLRPRAVKAFDEFFFSRAKEFTLTSTGRLLSADGREVHLSLNQGTTAVRGEFEVDGGDLRPKPLKERRRVLEQFEGGHGRRQWA
jgi:hypothetical protein